MLVVDTAHERSSRWQDLINEDEDGLFRAKLDALSDDIYKLTDGQVGGDEILLLIDGGDVGFLDLFADDLHIRDDGEWSVFSESDKSDKVVKTITTLGISERSKQAREGIREMDESKATYGNAIGVLGTNPLGFCLALLERMVVLEWRAHRCFGCLCLEGSFL